MKLWFQKFTVHDGGSKNWDLKFLHLKLQARGEQHRSFEILKPTPSDIAPPIRPHLLNLPKQFHQLQTKYWNISAFEGHSHPSHHIPCFGFLDYQVLTDEDRLPQQQAHDRCASLSIDRCESLNSSAWHVFVCGSLRSRTLTVFYSD